MAQTNQDIFTIYLIRHAEKQTQGSDPKNPPLTQCGELRAKSLATFFKTVHLKNVYSSNYKRTLNTVTPTAKFQQLEVETYDPDKLDEIQAILLKRKQDALVVGHSDTTSVLAGLLASEKLSAFDESIYDRIYQVVISNKKGRIHLLHQTFQCNE